MAEVAIGAEAPTEVPVETADEEADGVALPRVFKIAILAWESLHSVSVGSVAIHVSSIAEELGLRGQEVHMFVRSGPGQEDYELVNGVHYHRIAVEYDPDFIVEINAMCQAMIKSINTTEQFMNSMFDIMHCHDWMTVPALHVLKSLMDRKVIFTCHSTNAMRNGNHTFGSMTKKIWELEQDGVGYSDRVIGLSGIMCDVIKESFSFDWDKLRYVQNGFEGEAYSSPVNVPELRRKYGIHESDFVICYFGLFSAQKGVETLLAAFKKALEDSPKLKLFLLGEGSMSATVEHMAEELGISDRAFVRTRCSGSQRKDFYQLCDAVVIPGPKEIPGTTYLEAWAAGRPVIATSTSPLMGLITHQKDGLVVEPSVEGLTWALDYCASNPKISSSMGTEGQKRATSEELSWPRIAEVTNDVYNELFGIYPS